MKSSASWRKNVIEDGRRDALALCGRYPVTGTTGIGYATVFFNTVQKTANRDKAREWIISTNLKEWIDSVPAIEIGFVEVEAGG